MTRTAICFLIIAAAACAQAPSQGDRDYCMSELHATRKLFLDTIAGLSEGQLKWKPAGGGWSVLEVAEHIAATEQMIPQLVQKALEGPAAPEKKKSNPRETDAMLVKMLPVRDKKFQAPESIRPVGKYKSINELAEAFKAARDKNIAYVRETGDDLRGHFAPHPAFGDLDGLQWYVLIGGHTERHVNQIKEVMGEAGFPKK
ncbi:MAG: DinB family protein [Candidatus Solibacter usitatus]|nr:DinB family protein [Candidatus Solibacter usitatus]